VKDTRQSVGVSVDQSRRSAAAFAWFGDWAAGGGTRVFRRHFYACVALLIAISGAAGACTDRSELSRARTSSDNCFARGWRECKEEPYPFDVPPPSAVPTAVDGVYTRTVPASLAWAPGKCRRCPPYRLEPGRETLTFVSGRFFVAHHPPGFRSSGHFTESDGQIVLFNDANCLGFRGTYSWTIDGGKLLLNAIEDECPYTRLRQRFLMAKAWKVPSDG
jgi:hypothetical protein